MGRLRGDERGGLVAVGFAGCELLEAGWCGLTSRVANAVGRKT